MAGLYFEDFKVGQEFKHSLAGFFSQFRQLSSIPG